MSRKSAKSSPESKPPVPAAAPFNGFKFIISSVDAGGEKMIGEICFGSARDAMRWLRESCFSVEGQEPVGSSYTTTMMSTNIKKDSGIRSFDLRIVSG